MYERSLMALTLLFLAACAGMPGSVRIPEVTPAQLSADRALLPRGSDLYWGGEIVAVENHAENTVLEIIAYPLTASGEPATRQPSLGRFLADQGGFLEPREYRPGRRVTVSGTLLGFQDRRVGEALLPFPALQVRQLQLWDDALYDNHYRRPRVSVGISGGSHGSGVGVGIGF